MYLTLSPTKNCITPIIVAMGLLSSPSYGYETIAGLTVGWTNLEDTRSGDINPQYSGLNFTLALKTDDSYFKDEDYGYYFEFGLDAYSLSRLDNWIGEDIYTSTSGSYFYLFPVAFYEAYKGNSSDVSVKIGVGAGIGYVSSYGNLVVNYPAPAVRDISDADVGYTYGLFVRYTYKNFVLHIKEYTTYVTLDGLDLNLQQPSITLGYRLDM